MSELRSGRVSWSQDGRDGEAHLRDSAAAVLDSLADTREAALRRAVLCIIPLYQVPVDAFCQHRHWKLRHPSST